MNSSEKPNASTKSPEVELHGGKEVRSVRSSDLSVWIERELALLEAEFSGYITPDSLRRDRKSTRKGGISR